MSIDITSCTTFIEPREGHCWWKPCGKPLTGRQRRWCSDECSQSWGHQHWWTSARHWAVVRDNGVCQHCGKRVAEVTPAKWHWSGGVIGNLPGQLPAEVNHIEPRQGRGYGSGCHNHLDNLETLCHDCHVKVTANQQGYRTANERANQLAMEFAEVRRAG